MMRFPTEFRIFLNKKETKLERDINSFIAGNIKNLTIKEDYIMLEKLQEQKAVYVAELENLKATDLETIKNERFEFIKEKIEEEVVAEFNEKVAAVELKIKHYDFVIDELLSEIEQPTEEVIETMEV